MLIDWFTVIAQIANFLILVWLLQRFLYHPILEAIDAREKRIATELAEAEANKEEARKERDSFQNQNEEFSRQRATLFREAMLEVKAERERLFEEARNEAEKFRTRQQEAMIDDCNTLKEEILRRTREEVFAITRKTLADLAGENLEKLMVETFIQRCRMMDATEKADLQSVLKSPGGPVCIRSTFPLPDDQRQAIEDYVSVNFAYTGEFHFETAPDLVSGITVSMDGHELAWNITDYLLSLEKGISDMLIYQSHYEDQKQADPAAAAEIGRSGAEAQSFHGVSGNDS
jgi:F-type H+-transporting ATPase subunit b